jgi:putative ABC transport system ATP-binding protein
MIVEKNKLTTMMITHNLNSAIKTGTRTVMMDSGNIILDIRGEERDKMTLNDLLEMYSQKSSKTFDNDRMLLSK